jgi:TolA-binding protein
MVYSALIGINYLSMIKYTCSLRKIVFVSMTLWSTFFQIKVNAQLTQSSIEPDASFKQAKILFQQGAYSLAYPLFKNYYSTRYALSSMPVIVKTEAKYYYIISGLKMSDPLASDMAKLFIEQEADIAQSQLTAFYLGEYYYSIKQYEDALLYFAKSNIANLNNRQIAEMKFHQAYCYFIAKKFDKAKSLFNSIRQLPKDPNYADANYYYGFILFSEQKYKEAIPCFQIAENDPSYKSVVSFYLAELYYFSGDKDKSLMYAENALQKKDQYYNIELKQLLGHILFEKRQFDKALPYLEQYVSQNNKVRREDLYELSYCYYEAKNWNKAIEGFKQLGGATDSLEQNSMYLLGDAYLKINDLQNARNAFQFCASNNSNSFQKEVSAFNYAKLSYDLGYFNVAANSLKTFISSYPKSNYLVESKELLVSTLAHTSSFKDGLILYEQLTDKSENAEKIYPGLLYGRAVELINDQQVNTAETFLERILSVKYNALYLPMVYFWKGELSYRDGKIDLAIEYLKSYLKNPSRNGEVNSTNARYNLAYSYLKNESYKLAREQFELVYKAAASSNLNDVEKDAYIRTADGYFMAKDYRQALTMYERVIQSGWVTADYAIYQKGIIAGAQNKNKEKVQLLNTLEQQFPKSLIIPNAQMEIANTYIADEAFEKALSPLYKILNNYTASTLYPQTYLKLGIALFNLDKNDASLDQFKMLVSKYPNSLESESAVEYIRNIFVEKQQPEEYIGFMQSNGKNITVNEADSLVYRSAILKYEAKDLAAAQIGFTNYITTYPDGKYKMEANYFLAEIYVTQKKMNEAVLNYNTVVSLSPNKYAERSALQSSRIYYFDLKNFVEAAKYFSVLKKIAVQQENRLEAMRGLLRCQFKIQEWKEALSNATELLDQKGIAADDKLMAGFVIAKNEQLNNKPEQALTLYKSLLNQGKSEITAEAQYRTAELLFQLNNLEYAENACFEVIKKFGSYDIWVTKSYLLIGDIYFKQNDLFNAEATFKSVADNALIPELKKEAAEKLLLVISQKNKTNKVQ